MRFNICLFYCILNYIKIGEGKEFIVFLHGWGADLNSFYWLKNFYNDKVLLFVDFAGFGKSEEPDKPYFVDDYVLEVKDLLDRFQIESLYLVGHSFGGRVAIKYSCFFILDNLFFIWYDIYDNKERK